MKYRGAALLMGCAMALAMPAGAESYHLILTGSGGEPEYQERFTDWGQRLVRGLEGVSRAKPENIRWLAERVDGLPAGAEDIALESIEAAFEALAAKAGSHDDVYVYIIGHGSGYSNPPKFHIPGDDATAADFAGYLALLNVRRIVVLNAAPASAGFINELSAPNRVICSATKSVGEFNATHFMEYFIQSIEDGSADRNHDERVSVHEACAQASELTIGWYTAEGLIPTEHAILDDNGDGLGTRLFDPEAARPEDLSAFDGELAAKVYLKDFSFPESVPQELVDAYLKSLEEIEVWKESKASTDAPLYRAGLEDRLLKAARLNRDIHRHLPPDTGNS